MKNVSRKPDRRCFFESARMAMMVRMMVRRGARRKRAEAAASQTEVTMSVTRELASPLETFTEPRAATEFSPLRNNGELCEGDMVTVVQVAKPSLVKHNLDWGDV